MDIKQKPIQIFVVGHPRSGTTLLQTLIAKRLSLYSPPETHFLKHIFFRRSPFKSRFLVEKPHKSHVGYKKLEAIHKSALDYRSRSLLAKPHLTNYINLLNRICRENKANGWLEKCPENLFYCEFINKHIKCAQFFHIIRDPVANLASLKSASINYPEYWNPATYQDLDKLIEEYNRSIVEHLKFANKANHHIIRYESLGNPDALNKTLDETYPNTAENKTYKLKNERIIKPQEKWKSKNFSEEVRIDNRTKAKTVFSAEDIRKIRNDTSHAINSLHSV